ncbi:DUF6193 family natural product biosynthesis protein [Spirillospora sp. NPDC049024]
MKVPARQSDRSPVDQNPDPAVLYPDVATHGSMAAALNAAAAEQGSSLAAEAAPADPLLHATVASVLPHREAMHLAAWPSKRGWSVSGSANNGVLLLGFTSDLNEVAEAALGWAEGTGLDQIGRAAPFDVLTGRFEVPDGNAADVIESEWRWMLEEARKAEWPEFRALVEAVYAEPALRRFFPYTSHWALGFATAPDLPFDTPGFVSVDSPVGEGEYTVREWWDGPVLAQARTPGEAVGAAVELVPSALMQQSAHVAPEG